MLELSRCLSSPLLLVSGEISETTRVMLTFKLGYAKKVFGTMEIPSGCGLFLYESTYLNTCFGNLYKNTICRFRC